MGRLSQMAPSQPQVQASQLISAQQAVAAQQHVASTQQHVASTQQNVAAVHHAVQQEAQRQHQITTQSVQAQHKMPQQQAAVQNSSAQQQQQAATWAAARQADQSASQQAKTEQNISKQVAEQNTSQQAVAAAKQVNGAAEQSVKPRAEALSQVHANDMHPAAKPAAAIASASVAASSTASSTGVAQAAPGVTAIPPTSAPGPNSANETKAPVVDLCDSDDGTTEPHTSKTDKGTTQVRDSHGTLVLTGDENMVDENTRTRIRAFLRGTRASEMGSAAKQEVMLHKESIQTPDKRTECVELVFEMNFGSGKWRKIRRVQDMGPNVPGKTVPSSAAGK